MATWHENHLDQRSLGDRAADAATQMLGGWKFFWGMTAFIVLWFVAGGLLGFDSYPYQFLTLMLSLQASYAAPLILMAQNRQGDRDRANSDADSEMLRRLEQRFDVLERHLGVYDTPEKSVTNTVN